MTQAWGGEMPDDFDHMLLHQVGKILKTERNGGTYSRKLDSAYYNLAMWSAETVLTTASGHPGKLLAQTENAESIQLILQVRREPLSQQTYRKAGGPIHGLIRRIPTPGEINEEQMHRSISSHPGVLTLTERKLLIREAVEKLLAIYLRTDACERGMKTDRTSSPSFWRFLQAGCDEFIEELALLEDMTVPITESIAKQIRDLLNIEDGSLLYGMQTQGFQQMLRLFNKVLKQPEATTQHFIGSLWTPMLGLLAASVEGLLHTANMSTAVAYHAIGRQNEYETAEEWNAEVHTHLEYFNSWKGGFLGKGFGNQLLHTGGRMANSIWDVIKPGDECSLRKWRSQDAVLRAALGTYGITRSGLSIPLGEVRRSEESNPVETRFLNSMVSLDGGAAQEAATEIYHRNSLGTMTAGFGLFMGKIEGMNASQPYHWKLTEPNEHVDGTKPARDLWSDGIVVDMNNRSLSVQMEDISEKGGFYNASHPKVHEVMRNALPTGVYRQIYSLAEPLPGDLTEMTRLSRASVGVEGAGMGVLKNFIKPGLWYHHNWDAYTQSKQVIFMGSEALENAAVGYNMYGRRVKSMSRFSEVIPPQCILESMPDVLLQYMVNNVRMEPTLFVDGWFKKQQTLQALGNLPLLPIVLVVRGKLAKLVAADPPCNANWISNSDNTSIFQLKKNHEPVAGQPMKLVPGNGHENLMKIFIDHTPPISDEVLKELVEISQGEFREGLTPLDGHPLLNTIFDKVQYDMKSNTEFCMVQSDRVLRVLEEHFEVIGQLCEQLQKDFQNLMKLFVTGGVLRKANLTSRQQTQAFNNLLDMVRRTALILTSTLVAAYSANMQTQVLLFGAEFFKVNTPVCELDSAGEKTWIPHMTPHLLAAFLAAKVNLKSGEGNPSLKTQCIQTAMENVVFFMASVPEATQALLGNEKDVEPLSQVVFTPSLIGHARHQDTQQIPRLFMNQLILTPLQNVLQNPLATPTLVVDQILQLYDLVNSENGKPPRSYFGKRTTSRIIGDQSVFHPLGRKAWCMAVANSPHNREFQLESHLPMSTQYEQALRDQYHRNEPRIVIHSSGLEKPTEDVHADKFPEQPNSTHQFEQVAQDMLDGQLVPISAPRALHEEGQKPNPMVAENGFQVTARLRQPVLYQTDTDVRFATFPQENVSESFPRFPVQQGAISALQHFRAIQSADSFNLRNQSRPASHACKTLAEQQQPPATYIQWGATDKAWSLGAIDPIHSNESDDDSEDDPANDDLHGCSPELLWQLTKHNCDVLRWDLNYVNQHAGISIVLSPGEFAVDRNCLLRSPQEAASEESAHFPVAHLLNSLPLYGFDPERSDIMQIRNTAMQLHLENSQYETRHNAVIRISNTGQPTEGKFFPCRNGDSVGVSAHSRNLMVLNILNSSPKFDRKDLQWLTEEPFCYDAFMKPQHRGVFNEICKEFRLCFDGQDPCKPWISASPMAYDVPMPQPIISREVIMVFSTRGAAARMSSKLRTLQSSDFAAHSTVSFVQPIGVDTVLTSINPVKLQDALFRLGQMNSYLQEPKDSTAPPASANLLQYVLEEMPRSNVGSQDIMQLLAVNHSNCYLWTQTQLVDTTTTSNAAPAFTPHRRPHSERDTIYTTSYSIGLEIPKFRPYGRSWNAFATTQGCCRDIQFQLLHGIDSQAPQMDEDD